MNLLDITLVAETLFENKVDSIKSLLEETLVENKIEVLNMIDISVVQKESLTGNYILLCRLCFEHPPKMIKLEVDDYASKATDRLKLIFTELVSSKNKLFSIKTHIIKYC